VENRTPGQVARITKQGSAIEIKPVSREVDPPSSAGGIDAACARATNGASGGMRNSVFGVVALLGYDRFDEVELSDRSWGLRRFGRRRRRFLPRIALALRPLPANDARNTLNFSD